jgi:hypothetical protein
VNRQKPFTDMLRVALLSGGGRRLRTIADKLVEKAEQGDLQAIREVIDRLDGKPVQAIERNDMRSIRLMSDDELLEIAQGGPADAIGYASDGGVEDGVCRARKLPTAMLARPPAE